MSSHKMERYCQTGASLGSLPDSDDVIIDTRRSSEARGFCIVSDYENDDDRVLRQRFADDDRDDDDANDRDYDEVAADVTATDNSSLHYQMEVMERNARNAQPYSDESSTKLRFIDALPQVLAAMIANMLPMQAGINMAYSAILIPQLSDPLADIHISKDEASWIASLVTISLPIGSLAIGPLIDRYGRRRISVLSTLPFLIGWLLVVFARTVYWLYAARLICGMAGGLSTVSIIYVSEIADARLRPALLCLNSVAVSLGILVTCCLGTFLEWRVIAVFYTAMTAVSFVAMLLLPESPHWLRTFRPEDLRRVQRSMRWIYRRNELYETNMHRLMQTQNSQQLQPMLSAKPSPGGEPIEVAEPPPHWFDVYRQPQVYKPLGILLALFVFQQLSGAYAIIFYSVNLFLKIGGQFGNGINEYGAMMMLGTIRFVMSIAAALLSQVIGRRRLMFISGLGMAACSLCAGLYMLYEELLVEYYARTENPTDDIDPERKGNDLVLLCFVLGYVAFCSLGFMVIPWILIGEVLPTQVKGVLGGAVMAAAYMLMFGAVKAFPYAMDWLEPQGLFFVFATMSFAGVVYVFVYMPETLGRSFEEIERRFRGMR